MKEKSEQPDSLTKRVIDHVASRIAKTKAKHPRRLITESLEPRILFSGSPVPPPDAPVDFPPTPQAQEAPPSVADAPQLFGQVQVPLSSDLEDADSTRFPLSTEEVQAILSLSATGDDDRSQSGLRFPTNAGSPIIVDGLETAVLADPDALAVLPQAFSSPGFGWSHFLDSPAPVERFWDEAYSPPAEEQGGVAILPSATQTAGITEGTDSEILWDPSLLDPVSAAEYPVDLDGGETVEVTILSSVSVVGSVVDRSSRNSNLEFSNPVQGRLDFRRRSEVGNLGNSVEGNFTLTSESGEVAVSDEFSDSVTVVADGWLTVPDSNLEDLSSGFDFPPVTDSISLGHFSDDRHSRGTDRLFVDLPPGFDFTALHTGDYRELILAGNPLRYSGIGSEPEVSQTPSGKKKGKYKQKSGTPPSLSTLAGSVSGKPFAGDEFSIEVWVKARTSSGHQSLFAIDDESDQPRAFSCELDGSSLLVRHRTAAFRYRENRFLVSNAFPESGSWHHLVVTRHGDELAIFIDGNEVTPPGCQVSGLSVFGRCVRFGTAEPGSKLTPFDGDLSEFAIYDFPLDSHTASIHYHTGFAHGPFASRIAESRKRKRKESKPVFPTVIIGAEGWVSKSTSRHRKPDPAPDLRELSEITSANHGSPDPDQAEVTVIQSLLDRVAEHDCGQVTTGKDLGIFVSQRTHGVEAEVKELDWEVVEEILAHFGIDHGQGRSGSDSTHSLFLYGGMAGRSPRGFVTEVAGSGQISKVTPLNFEFGPGGSLAGPDLVSALRMPASPAVGSSRRSDWKNRGSRGDNHLDKVSSVQSDVFGIRE